MVEHLPHPISIADIAEAAGVTGRTLFDAFKKSLGVTPMSYLKARRLEHAHLLLLAAKPKQTTVTDVAMESGLLHLGRFAVDYRETFEESPSETLRR